MHYTVSENLGEKIGRSLRKKGLNAFAKNIDPCQPAQSAQADMGRNFSHSLEFPAFFQRNIQHDDTVRCLTKWIL